MSALRFAYLTDTHLGAAKEIGWHMQPRIADQGELLKNLSRWLKNNDVAFVVHGGDMIDHGSLEEINQASEWYSQLDCPVYLCLGNHDLALPESIEHWRQARGGFLPGGQDCFSVDAGAAVLLVMSHHWDSEVDFQWRGSSEPRLDQRQEDLLRAMLDQANRPVIAVTHAPLNDVSAEQRGEAGAFHLPDASYLAVWKRMAQEYSNLHLVLSGHNHVHSQHDHGSFISCTTAAFGELPAQLRLVTVGSQLIDIKTIALAEALGLSGELNPELAWCIGLERDQSLSIPI